MVASRDIERAVARVVDQQSFVQILLTETLGWDIPEGVERVEDIAYGWTPDDLRTADLKRPLVEGQAWQIQAQAPSQPWGVFLLQFQDGARFTHRGGLTGATGTLRKVLRGLLPSRRGHAALPSWRREHLLFICTHDYRQFRFAYFKAPRDDGRTAPLAAFGWNQGDTYLRTLCEFNLPALAFPDDGGAHPDAWVRQWASAFDVEAVTKRFFAEYHEIFEKVEASVRGVPAGAASTRSGSSTGCCSSTSSGARDGSRSRTTPTISAPSSTPRPQPGKISLTNGSTGRSSPA